MIRLALIALFFPTVAWAGFFGPGLYDNSVGTGKLKTDAVTTVKILNLAVDTGKHAPDSVTTSKIINAGVDTAKVKDDSIITAKILNLNVTGAKVAALTLDSSKLAANSVDKEKMATVFLKFYTMAELDARTATVDEVVGCSDCSVGRSVCIGTAAVICGYKQSYSSTVGCGTGE